MSLNEEVQYSGWELHDILVSEMAANKVNTNVNGLVTFMGFESEFNARVPHTKNLDSVTKVSISIVGQKVEQPNKCCYYSTIAASILILPLFFMCCQWWMDIVYQKYVLATETYFQLQNLMACYPKIQTLCLTVTDNSLDKEKLKVIDKIPENSHIKAFSLHNFATATNYRNKEFSDFKENVYSILKKQSLKSVRIKWDDIVLNSVKAGGVQFPKIRGYENLMRGGNSLPVETQGIGPAAVF